MHTHLQFLDNVLLMLIGNNLVECRLHLLLDVVTGGMAVAEAAKEATGVIGPTSFSLALHFSSC